MKAVVYHGHEDFRVEQVDDPALQAGTDAIVRVTRTAICGSDLHMWHGPTIPIPGFIMGHEVLGVIEDVGNDVHALKKGDQVALVGFGTFAVKHRAARAGRNPQTGATIQISAANVPSFKAGKALKEAVNS